MNIARINVNTGGDPTPGYQGDEGRFRDLEALVGKPLPASYIEFLRTHDGGHPEASSFFPPGEDDYDYSHEINSFYTLSDGKSCVFNAFKSWRETLGEGILPIANDGGNNQIYLDLNETPPPVCMWLHDVEELDENGESVEDFLVADSFEAFIDGLTIDPNLI
jgi:hypothetical protein